MRTESKDLSAAEIWNYRFSHIVNLIPSYQSLVTSTPYSLLNRKAYEILL